MTITELIAALEAVLAEHGDVPVLIQGYEAGADDFFLDTERMVRKDYDVACMGRYGWSLNAESAWPEGPPPTPADKCFTAVVLMRDTD